MRETEKVFRITSYAIDDPSKTPVHHIILAEGPGSAIRNFENAHRNYVYQSQLELPELTKEMIEGALDDDLDNMYEPYNCLATDEQIPASKIIRLVYPEKYARYFENYIDRNHIIWEPFSDGKVRYFELPED